MRLEEVNKDHIHYQRRIGNKSLKFYHIICMLYCTLLFGSTVISARLFPLHLPWDATVPMGTGLFFFPFVFFLQDVVTEVYGYARSRQMVWMSIFMLAVFLGLTLFAVHLPSMKTALYARNSDFLVVFDSIPRHFLALIVAMFLGSIINDYFMSKSKIRFRGRYLWMRSLGSTMVGEALMQVIGVSIGWLGTMHITNELLPNISIAYCYKLLFDAAMLPFIYLAANYLRRVEGVDVYDFGVNYNPFSLSLRDSKSQEAQEVLDDILSKQS